MKEVQFVTPMRQTNAFAMQYGLLLGLWSLAGLFVMFACLLDSQWSALGQTMLIGSPFLGAFFTLRFRNAVTQPGDAFTFGRGYLHTLFMGLYASLWIALGVFVYFSYFDGGRFVDILQQWVAQPANAQSLQLLESQGMFDEIYRDFSVDSFSDVLDTFRNVPPAAFAGMILYWTLLSAPVISIFVGLFAMRRGMRMPDGYRP